VRPQQKAVELGRRPLQVERRRRPDEAAHCERTLAP
jgi:hypothetical protein